MSANMQKIAKTAGVSLATVSKAFSNSKEISEKKRKEIFEIAKELNCFDKYNKNKTTKKVIAIICPEVSSAYYTQMVHYLENDIRERGAISIIATTNFNNEIKKEYLSYFASDKSVSGIIILSSTVDIKPIEEKPIVYISTGNSNNNVDGILIDEESPFDDAIDLLINNGHKKIAFLGEKLSISRFNLFNKCMKKHNLLVDDKLCYLSNKRFEDAGYEGMEYLYNNGNLPTAIITGYDYIALGAIQSIRTHGQNIPEDFSIIGIDNIPFDSHYNISLTSISENNQESCKTALDLLFKKIEDKYYKLRKIITIRGELIVRHSVGKAKE